MAETQGPIYTGGGIPLKGFDGLIEAAANAATLQQRRTQQLQNSRLSQQNRIQKLMDDVYKETGADLAPGLRPFWAEHVALVDAQIQNMTLLDGSPITSIAQGQKLLRDANAFYDELYGYDHFQGKYAPEDEINMIQNLIADPAEQEKFERTVPVDKTYDFNNAEKANSQLASMVNYGNYGFMGVPQEEIIDGTYMNGGYQNYGMIDYSGETPHLIIKNPNGVADRNSSTGYASSNSYLAGLSVYGANNQQLYNVERFAVDRAADDLYALGQEFLEPLVKADRVGLPWELTRANQLVGGLVRSTDKSGQRIRYSMLTQVRTDNPGYLSPEEERAFLFNNAELAFGKTPDGKVDATASQISALTNKFESIMNTNNYIMPLINGSNYDRAMPADTKEEERNNQLDNVLLSMTTINPNDIFALDDVVGMIDSGNLLNGAGQAEAFNASFARLLAESDATIGGQIQPGMSVGDITLVSGPSFSMVGTQINEDAGITRKFIENFEGGSSNLPQTIGNFSVNMRGSTEFQFSPQTGVEGGVDNVFFTRDSSGKIKIGVALNKSGVSGHGVSSTGKPIVPLEGAFEYEVGDPFFVMGVEADGSNILQDLTGGAGLGPNSQLLGRTYETGSPDLVFYFDPTDSADQNKLATLGSKLDEFFGKRGEVFSGAVNPAYGYTLNAMMSKALQ